MGLKNVLLRAGVTFILLACIGTPAFPQAAVSLGTIEGTVMDETGGILPGVTVTIHNDETGFTRVVTTDDNGVFRAPLLPVGLYTVLAELTGFKTMRREGLEVTVGGTVTLPQLVLEVATVEETVTVTAESPLVETSRSVPATTINDQAIHTLPVNSRDFQDFATFTPTVIRETDRDTISMGGARGIDTGVQVDGTDFTNTFFGSAHGQPEVNQFVISQEAVREFQVMANGYSAEIGRSAGGVLNVVTKSGTNDFHGSGFVYLRNEGLSSQLDLVDGTKVPKTDFSQQQYGGSIGGPIVQDKAHFFVSVDQSRFDNPFLVRHNQDTSGIPTNTQLYGAPIAGVDTISSLEGEFQREINLSAFLAKVDIQMSQSNTLSARYNYSDFDGINFGASAGGVEGNVQSSSAGNTELTGDTAHSFVVSNTTVIGTNKFNELKFQYAFESRPREGTNSQGPDVRIDDCCRFGRLGFLPITSDHSRWQVTNNFTYLFGSHDLKIGGDLNFTETSQGFYGFSAGEWGFATLDDYLNNVPRSLFQRVGLNGFTTPESGTVSIKQREYALYVQDNWRVSPGLTVNLGLRWEGLNNPQPPAEEFGLPATNPADPGGSIGLDHTVIPSDYKMLQPRLGLAWDPNNDGRTVVRAGAGIFYARTPLLLFAAPITTNGYRQALFFFFQPSPDFIQFPNVLPEAGIPPDDPLNQDLPPSEIFFVDSDFRNSQNQRFNVGVEQELSQDFSVGVDYVFNHAIWQQRRHDLNLQPPVSFDEFNRGQFEEQRIDDGYAAWWVEKAVGNARYQALALSLKKRMSNNFEFQAFYTLSDNKSHDDNERDSSGSRVSQPENLDVDWGTSARHVAHRFAGYALFQLPAGVAFSTVFTANSGRPYDILAGEDTNGDIQDGADRGVVDASTRPLIEAAGQDVPDGLQERNTGRQPSFFNMDLRVQWGFSFAQDGQVDLVFDIFNVFNNPNRSTDLFELSSNNFGALDLIGSPRQAQFGVRLQF